MFFTFTVALIFLFGALHDVKASEIPTMKNTQWVGAPIEIFELKESKKVFISRGVLQTDLLQSTPVVKSSSIKIPSIFKIESDLKLQYYYMKDELLEGVCFRNYSLFCFSNISPYEARLHSVGGISLFSYERYVLPRLPQTIIRTEVTKVEKDKIFFKTSVIDLSKQESAQTDSDKINSKSELSGAPLYSKIAMIEAPVIITKNYMIQKILYKKKVSFDSSAQGESVSSKPKYFKSWDQPEFASKAVFALGQVVKKGFSTVGTGFFISDSGLALTNHHVLNMFGSCFEKLVCDVFIRTQISKTKYLLKSVRLKVLAADEEYDFALFETFSHEGPFAKTSKDYYNQISTPEYLKLSLQNSEDSIYSVGYPVLAGGVQTSSVGRVLMLTSRYNFLAMRGEVTNWNSQLGLYYQTSLLGGQGNSGSPVLGFHSKEVQGLIARGLLSKTTDGEIAKLPLLLQAVSISALDEQFDLAGYMSGEKKKNIASFLKEMVSSKNVEVANSMLKKFEIQKTFLGTEELYKISYEHPSVEIRKLIMSWLTKKGFVRTSSDSTEQSPSTILPLNLSSESVSNNLSQSNLIHGLQLYHYRVEDQKNPVEQGYVVFTKQKNFLRPQLLSGDMTDFLCFSDETSPHYEKSCQITLDKKLYFNQKGFSFPVQILRGILPERFSVVTTFTALSDIKLTFLTLEGKEIAKFNLALVHSSNKSLRPPLDRLGLKSIEIGKVNLINVSQNITYLEEGRDRNEVHLVGSQYY